MELTILGSSGTWPGPGRATCGYLLSHEGSHLWLDAGCGTFARLQQRIAVHEMTGVAISHGHPDHFSDLLMCFYARRYGHLGEPGLPVFAPGDFMEKASLLVSEDGQRVLEHDLAVKPVHHGDRFEVGPFAMEVFEMQHVGGEAVGYRIEAGGAVLAYSGDGGPSPALVDLARGADLFLCEATYQDGDTMFPFHSSARQAGEHAAAAGAKRLMLTHIVPTSDPARSVAEASEVFDGPVSSAEEGAVEEITA